MQEKTIEKHIRKFLVDKGWKIRKAPKRIGEHGVDIHAWHPKRRRVLFMEMKGGSGKHKHAETHNAFYNVLGQIISRMDIQGNHPKKGRIYAIGIPCEWLRVFKNKIKKMKYGWRLLKLRVFLAKKNGEVIEKPYSKMLK
jgi:hypothetical protein